MKFITLRNINFTSSISVCLFGYLVNLKLMIYQVLYQRMKEEKYSTKLKILDYFPYPKKNISFFKNLTLRRFLFS